MQITSNADEHANYITETYGPRLWAMVADRQIDDGELEELVTLEMELKLGAEESAHATRKAVRNLRGGSIDRHMEAEAHGLERMRRVLGELKALRQGLATEGLRTESRD